MLFQAPLPDKYRDLLPEQIEAAVYAHKQRLGRRLVILGHHYQQDRVIQFADFTGDSLKLAQIAAEQRHAQFVVFCGVHFMAESADILTDDQVAVILPDLSAGCSMADMAQIDDVEEAWEFLTQAAGDARIVPVTYVNSLASVKAFCGRHGGACCTSSNARLILQWALGEGEKVLFLPDQHLGRNTAYALGHPLESMVVFDPQQATGGLTAEQVRRARFFLWKGHCSVHQLFTPQHCQDIRRADGNMKILVHPECTWEVVQAADLAGSTEYIVRTIDQSPAGSRWAVGTENHLVHRLAQRHAGNKTVRSLAGIQCLCTTMYRISPQHVLWSLDNLAEGKIVNQIKVDPDTKRQALIALERMLANVSAQPVAAK